MAIKKVLFINGPNLNLLGTREPEIYGNQTLADIDNALVEQGNALGLTVETYQSNHEGAIVDKIQVAARDCHGLVINPAAYTHTSIAIRDALLVLDIPVIEVHLSNTHKREPVRQQSMLSDVVTGKIIGLGPYGYTLALAALAHLISEP
jgi:3-dehydroquinate dehydratase-2